MHDMVVRRSDTLAQAVNMRERWFSAVAEVGRCRSEGKENLRRRRIYRRGSRVLWRLLNHVNLLLQPAQPVDCAVQQPISCVDDDQVSSKDMCKNEGETEERQSWWQEKVSKLLCFWFHWLKCYFQTPEGVLQFYHLRYICNLLLFLGGRGDGSKTHQINRQTRFSPSGFYRK